MSKPKERVLIETFMGHDIYNIGNKIQLVFDYAVFKNIVINSINMNMPKAGYCNLLMSPCPNCGNDTIQISKLLKDANKKFKGAYGKHLFCFINSTVKTDLHLTTLGLNYTMQHKLDVDENIKIYKSSRDEYYDPKKEHLASICIYRNEVLEASFFCKVKNNQIYSQSENI